MGESKHKGRYRTMGIALLSIALLVGCGDNDTETHEGEAPAKETAVDTGEKPLKKEDLPTREEIEAEFGEVEHPLIEIFDFTEEVTVTSVVDNNTIIVEGEDGEETVQFAGIEMPDAELSDGTMDEYYGFSAAERMRSMEGSVIRLERVKGQKSEDGHTLGYIWWQNAPGYSFHTEQLLLDGVGRFIEMEDDKYTDELRAAENEAKKRAAAKEQDNIWTKEGYVTEDGYDDSFFQ